MFEEITDTFSDMGDGAKKGFEKIKDFISDNKLLCIGIGGVAVFALYKMYTDKTVSEDTEYTATYAYVPTGYDGYPTMSASLSYDDAVDQLKGETADDMSNWKDEIMSDITQIVDKVQDDTDKKINAIVIPSNNDRYNANESPSYVDVQRENEEQNTVTYEDIVAQMQKNSEMWHQTDSQEQKDLLHQQNVQLGTMLGATFDSGSGTWNSDGTQIYDVSVKNKSTNTTGGTTKVSGSSGSNGSSGSTGSGNNYAGTAHKSTIVSSNTVSTSNGGTVTTTKDKGGTTVTTTKDSKGNTTKTVVQTGNGTTHTVVGNVRFPGLIGKLY